MNREVILSFVKRLPWLYRLLKWAYFRLIEPLRPFSGSAEYWEARYARGGTSGPGSRGDLAAFKADVINSLVSEHDIATVIEFGCGDGGQLSLLSMPAYLGVDVSATAVSICRRRFPSDPRMRFVVADDYQDEVADLALSLDVIYHLVEDAAFERYMVQLFTSSRHFVLIYSSNTEGQGPVQGAHIRHRRFTDWVNCFAPEWVLERHIANPLPFEGDPSKGSLADFFLFRREGSKSYRPHTTSHTLS